MQPTPSVFFLPFRLDLLNECLWRGAQEIALRPKTFSVLRYLVERHGRLVRKKELLDALWPGLCITDGVLMACIRELRKALNDNPRAPQFIETVHRRGYRFIAETRDRRLEISSPSPQASSPVGQEAMSFLTQGLEQLKVMPDLPERIQQEIDILLTLGKSLAATAGSAAPEVERVYARAHALCQQIGETPQLLIVLLGLQLFYAVRGELQTARELAEQCLRLAQQTQDVNFLLWSHLALGNTLFQLGDLVSARMHLEQGAALYTLQKKPCSSSSPVEGARMGCLCWLAFSLWALGYPEQAVQRIREALTQAQELNHPYSLVIASTCAAALHVFRREARAAQEQAEAAIAIATEQGFAQWVGLATVLQGWALVEQEHYDEGFAQMRRGTVTYRNTGAELSLPHQLAFLAEACEKAGQIEEGLNALAEALAIVNKTGARFNEAELYRLKGQLTLQSWRVKDKSKTSLGQVKNKSRPVRRHRPLTPDPQAEAEACFQRAIGIARRQSAKSLELRAATNLARLWQQGRKEEAHQMLAEVYCWFTEGFDTKDLQEAKALLQELA